MGGAVMGSVEDGIRQTTEEIDTGIFVVTATVGNKTIHHYCIPSADAGAPQMVRVGSLFIPSIRCTWCLTRYDLLGKIERLA